jgi:hypothetical protein
MAIFEPWTKKSTELKVDVGVMKSGGVPVPNVKPDPTQPAFDRSLKHPGV